MSEQMISKYNIRLTDDKQHIAADKVIAKNQSDAEYVRHHKDEILQILLEREAEAEKKAQAYREKHNAIEGLEELEKAIVDWNTYNRSMSRYIERDCTGKAPVKPSNTVDELSGKYPRAAAYIKADQWSLSTHFFKATCGDKAKCRILDGDNYKEAIDDMEAAWAQYVNEHAFD